MIRVADEVARTLAAHGVRLAFGMPGGEVVTLIDALAGAGIRFVLARHETAAAIMAAGAHLLGRAPGLLVTTLGPGLANAVNGIADAMQERVPLIVVSGVVDRAIRGRYTHQIIDHAQLLRPLVKASFEIETRGAAATVARALALATTPPMGPVHLDLAPGVAATAVAATPMALPIRRTPRSDPDDPAIAELRARLAAARRPLALAGWGAVLAGAAAPLRAMLEEHGVPVLTTYKAKGVVDERHPLALGAVGLSPRADGVLLPLVASADLVLLVGYDPIEMRPGWLDPFRPQATVVELAAAHVDHGMHAAHLQLQGDLGSMLQALAHGPIGGPFWTEGEPAAAKAALADRLTSADAWGPHAVVEALATTVPAEATITVDSGAHRILLSQLLPIRRPLGLLQSAGFCTVGAALPLAAGAALAEPARRVVAVLGDGGLEMGLGELGTLRDQALSVVLVVLQDASLALIELKQAQAGLGRCGVGLGRTDYPAIARAFGGHGVEVADAAALRTALAEALTRDRFTLIACRIEAAAYVDAF